MHSFVVTHFIRFPGIYRILVRKFAVLSQEERNRNVLFGIGRGLCMAVMSVPKELLR